MPDEGVVADLHLILCAAGMAVGLLFVIASPMIDAVLHAAEGPGHGE